MRIGFVSTKWGAAGRWICRNWVRSIKTAFGFWRLAGGRAGIGFVSHNSGGRRGEIGFVSYIWARTDRGDADFEIPGLELDAVAV